MKCKKKGPCLLLLLLAFYPLCAQQDTLSLLQDIYLAQDGRQLRWCNQYLTLTFDKNTGRWQSLRRQNHPGNLIDADRSLTTLDFSIDSTWMVAQHGSRFLGYETAIARDGQTATLHLHFGIQPPDTAAHDTFMFTQSFALPAGKSWLERYATLTRPASPEADITEVKMEDFRFVLPGVVLGDAARCVVNVPGPWFPASLVLPNTPYADLLERDIPGFHSAPDAGFGVLSITNPEENLTLTTWMQTGGEVNYHPKIQSRGNRLDFIFQDHRAYRMPANFQVASDVQRIEIAEGSLLSTLESYRQMCLQDMPLDTATPVWVRKMILLEVYPHYFEGGFKEITQKLPFYQNIGFNAIYLMPHWQGGYSPIDLFKVNPEYGTAEDLKALTRTAHKLGMKVFFDMVIHGFNEKSPMMGQHPEYFVHDEAGRITRHRTWKSMSTDWGSPAYIQFMVDLVRHDLREYDIDGYRVDAASFKGPGWGVNVPYPAYRSGTDAPALMEKMLQALREQKPDAMLLNEVFGPVFYTVSNLSHDNNTEAPQQFLEKWEAGDATSQDYKKHMVRVFRMLPPGANRVFFARNHDTSWFYHFNGYTPQFMALEAIHAFCTIPEVFTGDRGRKRKEPNPEDDPAVFAHYRKLFAMKKRIPELSTGDLLLEAVEADHPNVFTALRRSKENTYLIVVSMQDTIQETKITFDTEQVQKPGEMTLEDPISGEVVKGKEMRLTLKPFQVLVGKL